MNDEYVSLTDYNKLKAKFTEQQTKIKSLQNENTQLRNLLNEFNDVTKKNEETKENIGRIIQDITMKIEKKKRGKGQPNIIQMTSFGLRLDGLYDKEYMAKTVYSIENEYKCLLQNFNRIIVKYKELYLRYEKTAEVNSRLINVNGSPINEIAKIEMRKEKIPYAFEAGRKDGNESINNGLCSLLMTNKYCEPVPSIVKCLTKTNVHY